MEYQECRTGRVFVARLHDNESIYDAIEELAAKENVTHALVNIVGGMRKAAVVTGPQNPKSLEGIVPNVERFDDAREVLGIGTIIPCEGKPTLHMHSGIGRGDKALVGCARIEAECFLVLEVVILELVGLDAERRLDPVTGFHLLEVPSRD
jgi:predicted DNA-binding protein with PD1-like motif